ncbi:hypothetical protein IWX50DRAFT_422853 [Phyllosticta citricarpa]|uniref:Secreted protein n=1 Tax=Phyllosticta citricarpa TaxID=55181 RepID=A0ABR1L384_9PEZI
MMLLRQMMGIPVPICIDLIASVVLASALTRLKLSCSMARGHGVGRAGLVHAAERIHDRRMDAVAGTGTRDGRESAGRHDGLLERTRITGPSRSCEKAAPRTTTRLVCAWVVWVADEDPWTNVRFG